MQKPILYQLCGLPFSGKSTLRRELVKKFNFDVASVDRMIGKHEFHVPDMTQEDWNLVYKEAYEELEFSLRTGKTVILDKGSLKRSERDTARDIAGSAGATYVLIYVNTPLETIQERRKRNQETHERGDLDDTHFQIALDQFVAPQADEQHIIYSADMDLNEWITANIS